MIHHCSAGKADDDSVRGLLPHGPGNVFARKNRYVAPFLAICFLLLASSCRDYYLLNEPYPNYKGIRVSADIKPVESNLNTRTEFAYTDSIIKSKWEYGDFLFLFTLDGDRAAKYTYYGNQGFQSEQPLDVEDGTEVYAAYIWQESSSELKGKGVVENGTLKLTMEHIESYIILTVDPEVKEVVDPLISDKYYGYKLGVDCGLFMGCKEPDWKGWEAISPKEIYDYIFLGKYNNEVGHYAQEICYYSGEDKTWPDYMILPIRPDLPSSVIFDVYMSGSISHEYTDSGLPWDARYTIARFNMREKGMKAGHAYLLNVTKDDLIDHEAEEARDREALIAFYNSTNGDNWGLPNSNWCTDKPIGTWFGVGCSNYLPSKGSFGNVTVLHLYLGDVNVSGRLPREIGNLKYLEQLQIDWNVYGDEDRGMGGRLPEELGNLTRLKEICLTNNHLVGTLPQSLSKLTNLEHVNLSGNYLEGDLSWLRKNSDNGKFDGSLGKWDLSYNKLSGETPSLEIVENISYNNYTGNMPSDIINVMVGYEWISHQVLIGNRFTGDIPDQVVNHYRFKDMLIDLEQQPGYGFNKPAQKFKWHCQPILSFEPAGFLNLAEEYAKHKYTLIVMFNYNNNYCYGPYAPIELAADFAAEYNDYGLGVIFATDDIYFKDSNVKKIIEQRSPGLIKFIPNQSQLYYDIPDERPEGFDSYDGIDHFFDYYPIYVLVDSEGNFEAMSIDYTGSKNRALDVFPYTPFNELESIIKSLKK